MEYYILTFPSVSSAMNAEKYFREAKISVKTIPVPPEISDGCGFAIRFDDVQVFNANRNIEGAKNAFYVKREDGKRITKKL